MARRVTRKTNTSYSKRSPAYKAFVKKINEYNVLVDKYKLLVNQIGAKAEKTTAEGRSARKRLTAAYNAVVKKGREVLTARNAVLKTR